MKRLSSQPGFTIIELLVAIGVAVLVIGFVNQMFNATSRAVTRGVQFGDVIVNNRSIAERLYEDGQAMVAPKRLPLSTTDETEGGMLVIFNRRITRGVTGVWMPDPDTPDDEFFVPSLRSDQLMFIKSTGSQPIETFAPVATNTFAGKGNHAASYAKVWWGHVQRTNPDGSPSTTLDTAAANDLNYNGWQWVLGRQELFLSDATPAGTTNPSWYTTPAVNINGVYWNSPATVSGPPAAIQFNWAALADVSNRPLFIPGGSASPTAPLISLPAGGGEFPDGLAEGTYRTQAYDLLFPETRLQVNDSPIAPYDSWRIAQMVPYIAQGVSDFIVEFAADTDKDAFVDVNASDEIIWYSVDNPPTFDPSYTYDPADPANPTLPADPGVAVTNADAAFVWRHDYPDNWPHLIRIRYRLHDGKGVVRTSENVGLSNAYVGQAIDYSVDNETAQSGRWFEIVIPVNREAD